MNLEKMHSIGLSDRFPMTHLQTNPPSRWLGVVLLLILVSGCSGPAALTLVDDVPDGEASMMVAASVDALLEDCRSQACGFAVDPGASVDSVLVDREARSLTIQFNDAFAQKPFRSSGVGALRNEVASRIGSVAPGWSTEMEVLGVSPDLLVPNTFDDNGGTDAKRWPDPAPVQPLLTFPDRPWLAQSQLYGRHIAAWHSHGWYYENRLDRWEWQRARLFQTVEDIFPMAFVVPYLAPMLERAGAFVHMPRERDVQPNEVVVDNDGHLIVARPDLTRNVADTRILNQPALPEGNRYLEVAEAEEAWSDGASPGFLAIDSLRTENPFSEGTHRVTKTSAMATAAITWIPDIPERGDYAVHVAFGRTENPTADAHYEVHHLGGITRVSVNQQMMAGTWVYLGTFPFAAGQSSERGQVILTNESEVPGRAVSADAVRFGGGMGSVVRGDQLSARPRYTEGARYYMQYAGFPDALVYNVTESANDYVDDYRGRSEWVNYLRGAPEGPNKDRSAEGFGVPVDLSFAFHTDAGITKSDATIGTLMIYSSRGMERERSFPAGFSRFANRDLGDMMQTQIVDDIRALYDSTWTRRAIWDRDYSEAVRPNVPGVLLELLSHQNYADMRFGLDPRYRFDVARSIYKSMARFMGDQYGFEPVIQPLAPDHMQARWNGNQIQLSWTPVDDPLEPTAVPDHYVVYMRTADGGFENGRVVNDTTFTMDGAEAGIVYGFRVSAVNAGGESAPSETVAIARASAARNAESPMALIVSAFDRVSGPGTLDTESYRGFASWVDEGVADGYDLSYVGDQYDFDIDSPWLDDDSPGHGASWSTWETRTLTGNTHDYPMVYAQALLASGMGSETVSDEVFGNPDRWKASQEAGQYAMAAFIFGEEKTTHGPGFRTDFKVMPASFRDALGAHIEADSPVFISGAHFATDAAGPDAEKSDVDFVEDVLGAVWRTNRATQRGTVHVLPGMLDGVSSISYNTDPQGPVYRVEHPDALDPARGAETIMRYTDNNMSAAVGKPGSSVVLGFPFETITDAATRVYLMRAIAAYLQQ